MNKKIAIHWFRQDLRLADNPALTKAAQHDYVLPIYILNNNPHEWAMGAASRCWLHHSLTALNASIEDTLSFYRGDPLEVFKTLVAKFDVAAVYWNKCYEPHQRKIDHEVAEFLQSQNIALESINASLLWESSTIVKDDGTPYKVFTPFYRKGCLNSTAPRISVGVPDCVYLRDDTQVGVDALGLLPSEDWHRALAQRWQIGEQGAQARLKDFIEEGLFSYKEGRNFPAKPCVSRLSPYLHFGEISPNQLWYTVRNLGDDSNIDHFCSELGWREFSYNLLWHNPDLPTKNLQTKFDFFPWRKEDTHLKAWQRGRTGVPMVDAGMRELWQTGFMHNRVRMIVGSFLVKNLRLHWQYGERWFWNTLVDADLANNSASWQWIAGCGADAAPYFRIFNPVTQGQKFDPKGEYVRRYLPELALLPDKYLFNPWEAPKEVLQQANVELGVSYPFPIVDLKQSRAEALDAFSSLKATPK